MSAEVAYTYGVHELPDGSCEIVENSTGRVLFHGEDQYSRTWALGMLRLAAHAHHLLRDNPAEIHRVLTGDGDNNLDGAIGNEDVPQDQLLQTRTANNVGNIARFNRAERRRTARGRS